MSPGHLRRLCAALQRIADRHVPRWASETLERPAGVRPSTASAAPGLHSGQAARRGDLFSSLGGHQQRAGLHSGPLGSSLRAAGRLSETGPAARGALSQLAPLRLLLASTLVPAGHVLQSAVSVPSGCACRLTPDNLRHVCRQCRNRAVAAAVHSELPYLNNPTDCKAPAIT